MHLSREGTASDGHAEVHRVFVAHTVQRASGFFVSERAQCFFSELWFIALMFSMQKMFFVTFPCFGMFLCSVISECSSPQSAFWSLRDMDKMEAVFLPTR